MNELVRIRLAYPFSSSCCLWRRLLPWICGGTTVLLALSIYVMTAAPTVYNLDSAELAIGVHTLGIVHATGYPLYLLLGKVFIAIVPFADLGYALNVLSALYASLTSLSVMWVVIQLTTHDLRSARWNVYGGAVAALFLGFSYYFWAVSVIAEVYTLQTWLLSMALGCLLRWDASSQGKWLGGFALFYGLCFANHISVLLTLPGLCLYMIGRRAPVKQLGKRLIYYVLPAALIGPLLYLYFPLRYRVSPYNLAGHYNALGEFIPVALNTLTGLWWLVSGKMFQTMAFAYPWREALQETLLFLRQFWGNFLGVGVVFGLIGLAVLWRGRKLWLFSLLLMFGAHAMFFVNYRVVDKALMFLPSYLVWTYLLGVGLTWVLQWVESVGGVGTIVNLGWSMLLVAILCAINYGYVDVSADYRARTQAQAFLDQAQPNALVVGWWTEVTPIQYLQYVEGQRPDLHVINRLMISDKDLRELLAKHRKEGTVYLLSQSRMYPLPNEH